MGKLIGTAVVTLAVLTIALNVSAQGEAKGKGRRGRGGLGKVTSVDQSKKTFVIETRDGSRTVTTSDSTEFVTQATAKIGDIKMKDRILALGQMAEDKQSIEAMRITVMPQNGRSERSRPAGKGSARPGGQGSGIERVMGTVVATGNELKVDAGEGKMVTIKAGDRTTVTKPGKGSFSDISVGKFVMVQGNPEGDTIRATRVNIVGERGRRGLGKARAKAKGQARRGSSKQ